VKKLLVLLFAFIGLYAESSVDLKIADTTASISLEYNLAFNKAYYAKAGYIYKDEENLDNFSYAGFLVKGILKDYTNHTLKAGIDIDLVSSRGDNKNYMAMPIGFEIIDSFRLSNFNFPFFMKGNFSYATKVLSFNDADSFHSYSFEMGANFIENVNAYMGYRYIKFNSNDTAFDDSIYLGIGFLF